MSCIHYTSPLTASFQLDTQTVPYLTKAHLFPMMLADVADMSRFDPAQLLRFTLTVAKNYRPLPYHNWEHAFHVAQFGHAILRGAPEHFPETEVRNYTNSNSLV